jgi:hypothetical protein
MLPDQLMERNTRCKSGCLFSDNLSETQTSPLADSIRGTVYLLRAFRFLSVPIIDRGPAMESRSQEVQSSGVAEWILLCWSVKIHCPRPN